MAEESTRRDILRMGIGSLLGKFLSKGSRQPDSIIPDDILEAIERDRLPGNTTSLELALKIFKEHFPDPEALGVEELRNRLEEFFPDNSKQVSKPKEITQAGQEKFDPEAWRNYCEATRFELP